MTSKTITRCAVLGAACVLVAAPFVTARAVSSELGNTRLVVNADSKWLIQLPKQDVVFYQGVANFDQAGRGAGTMLYPAPSPVGFLAALATHGILNASSRNSQKNKIQAEADKVLLPYRPLLDSYHYQELMTQAINEMETSGQKTLFSGQINVQGWLVEAAPIFSMTQDQSTIVIDDLIQIYDINGSRKKPVYENTIRVISAAQQGASPASSWMADSGALLKNVSADLFAASLDIAITDAAGSLKNGADQKTLHYMEGNAERLERGQAVIAHCDRILLRNLRGWLMSVPVVSGSAATSTSACTPRAGESALAMVDSGPGAKTDQ